MILPRNGRIVIVDDVVEEVLPLIKSLSKNGFAVTYFDGLKEALPRSPLLGVRVVFLDMQLNTAGYTGSNDKSKAAATANVFRNIIDVSSNTTYLVAIWSTHDELVEHFWKYVQQENCKSRFISIMIDKPKCASRGYAVSVIESEIAESLKDQNAFKFFINWENIIHQSSNDIVNDFSSFFPGDDKWDKNILNILKELAKAYVGKNLDEGNSEQITQNAMLAFNGTFRDSLENNIINYQPDHGISFDGTGNRIDDDIAAKINSKLLLSHGDHISRPGNIYAENDDSLLETMISDCFEDPKQVKQFAIQLICCEVSPFCDFAQKKWKVHRLLYGIKIPTNQKDKVKNKADYIYKTPSLLINDEIFKFVFDLRQLRIKAIEELKPEQLICTLRHDLVVDMQHKIAGHCSRPGMVSL